MNPLINLLILGHNFTDIGNFILQVILQYSHHHLKKDITKETTNSQQPMVPSKINKINKMKPNNLILTIMKLINLSKIYQQVKI